jgi:hypothetical protein
MAGSGGRVMRGIIRFVEEVIGDNSLSPDAGLELLPLLGQAQDAAGQDAVGSALEGQTEAGEGQRLGDPAKVSARKI